MRIAFEDGGTCRLTRLSVAAGAFWLEWGKGEKSGLPLTTYEEQDLGVRRNSNGIG